MAIAIESIFLSAFMLLIGFFGSGYFHRLRYWKKDQDPSLLLRIEAGKKKTTEELHLGHRVSVKTMGGQLFTFLYQTRDLVIVTVESGAQVEKPDMNRVVEL